MSEALDELKATATMSDKDWVAANKHVLKPEALRRGWYTNKVKSREWESVIDNSNNPQRELTPEQMLWSQWLYDLISDAQGIGVAAKEKCVECHLEQIGCGCPTREIERRWLKPSKKEGMVLLRLPGWRGFRETAESSFIVVNDKVYQRYHLREKCPNAHTLQQCAIQRINRWEFAQVCTSLNLEPDYMRKMAFGDSIGPRKRMRSHYISDGLMRISA